MPVAAASKRASSFRARAQRLPSAATARGQKVTRRARLRGGTGRQVLPDLAVVSLVGRDGRIFGIVRAEKTRERQGIDDAPSRRSSRLDDIIGPQARFLNQQQVAPIRRRPLRVRCPPIESTRTVRATCDHGAQFGDKRISGIQSIACGSGQRRRRAERVIYRGGQAAPKPNCTDNRSSIEYF